MVKAAEDVGKWFDDYHKMVNDPGAAIGLPGQRRPVPGFGPDIAPASNYLPRVYDHNKLDAALRRLGHDGVSGVFAAAMRQMQPELDEKALKGISRGIVKNIRSVSRDMDTFRASQSLFSGDLEGLKMLLKDIPDLDPEDAEAVIAQMTKPIDKGVVSRAKHRVLLDEGLRVHLPDGTVTTFGDLFLEQDVGKLMASYNRAMSGQVALAQAVVEKVVDGERILLIDGLAGPGKLEHYLQKIAAVGDDMGVPQTAVKAGQRDIEYLHKSTAGVPLYDQSTWWAQVLRLFREYGMARVGGQLGFAQAPEIGAIFTAGTKAALAGFPNLRVLIRDTKTGKLKDGLAQEIEACFGRGAERLRTAGDWRLSTEAEWGHAFETSPFMQRVEKVLGVAKRVTMEISGLNALNTFLHRWSTSAILHWFSRAANGEVRVSTQRLRAMGLTDDMTARALQQMRTYRTLEEGSTFKLTRLTSTSGTTLRPALTSNMRCTCAAPA
ncbi:hypothetical protein MWN34_02175 [Ancylobacter sp. 6x-1]|uniref:Uncharacterized protein n=1 Tax=Ancylobacter crimeensis TaxID=2579147 RepID=A0ABT0D6Z1_9HYPH|nr:hypothetical protein [Ancylobacter crimeensis]MCK0195711.1 hypothetical protein [Ancylobacter crimeensis]